MSHPKKIVLISGANRGLGEAFFDLLHANSEVDLVVSLSRKMSEYQSELVKQNDNRFQFIELDLSQISDRSKLLELGKYGDSDPQVTFINNAGIIEPIGCMGEFADDQIVRSINVNVLAPALITNYLIELFGNKSLKIINISSGAATRVIDGWGLYCSAKAYTHMLTNTILSQKLESYVASGANENPGVIDTDMQQRIRETDSPAFTNHADFVSLKEEGKLRKAIDVAADILKKHQLLS